MKRFICGLLVGLLFATFGIALAQGRTLRLIINGIDVTAEAQPVIIDGRAMVPIRFVTESLGAQVGFDSANYVVIITSAENKLEQPAPQRREQEAIR